MSTVRGVTSVTTPPVPELVVADGVIVRVIVTPVPGAVVPVCLVASIAAGAEPIVLVVSAGAVTVVPTAGVPRWLSFPAAYAPRPKTAAASNVTWFTTWHSFARLLLFTLCLGL